MAKSMISWYAEVEKMSAAAAAKAFGGVAKADVLTVFSALLKEELSGGSAKPARAERKQRKKSGSNNAQGRKSTARKATGKRGPRTRATTVNDAPEVKID